MYITFTDRRCEEDRWTVVVRMYRFHAAASIHKRRVYCQVYHSWERGFRIHLILLSVHAASGAERS